MSAWRIRNYSAFIHRSMSEHDLTHAQAKALYREMRSDLGRPVFAVDLERHPRIRNRGIERIEKTMFSAAEAKRAAMQLDDYIDEDYDYIEYSGGIDYE